MSTAPPVHTVQLDPHDDPVSVRDKLAFVRARRVVLLWPLRGRVLTRKLDLLLVQRAAAQLGMQIALVTEDPDVIANARDLRISIFPDEQSALQGRWKRPRRKVFTPPHDPDEQAAIAAHVARLRNAGPPRARRLRRLGRWALFLGLLIALVAGFLLVAPSATVAVTPASRQVFQTVTIVADPALHDIDIENYRMPATVITLQATARVTVEASGTEKAGASLAQGLVTFRNTTDQPVLIPRGTVVATSDVIPIRFATMIETTLPAGDAATIDVPVQALPEHAGPQGNVPPGAINRVEGELAYRVTVHNANATYGGAIQERKTVTEEDHARLLELARQQVLQNAQDLLLHQLSGEQFLVPGSVSIVEERPEWTIYNAIVGDLAESVSLDMRATVQAVIVDERQARQVAYAGIAPFIQPGMEVSPQTLRFMRGDIVQIEPSGRVTFLMHVRGHVAVAIDAEAVRRQVAGLRISAARRRLEAELLLDPSRPPRIHTWPAWFNRLPFLAVRITVEVERPQ